MTKLAKATGARIVTNLDDLSAKDLGHAKLAEERKVEEDKWVFIEGCKNPKAVTILISGGSQRVVDEAERSMHDALMVTKDVIEKPAIVAGGGAPEVEVAYQVREWTQKLTGREQLAALKFAEAVETIATILAENAGMDPIDTQVELRARHGKGEKWAGVDALSGKVVTAQLYEVARPERIDEDLSGVWQVVTWERQELVASSCDDFADEIDKTITGMTEAFIAQYNHFNPIPTRECFGDN